MLVLGAYDYRANVAVQVPLSRFHPGFKHELLLLSLTSVLVVRHPRQEVGKARSRAFVTAQDGIETDVLARWTREIIRDVDFNLLQMMQWRSSLMGCSRLDSVRWRRDGDRANRIVSDPRPRPTDLGFYLLASFVRVKSVASKAVVD